MASRTRRYITSATAPALLGLMIPVIAAAASIAISSASHRNVWAGYEPGDEAAVAMMGVAEGVDAVLAMLAGCGLGLVLATVGVRRRGALGGLPLVAVLVTGTPLVLAAGLVLVSVAR